MHLFLSNILGALCLNNLAHPCQKEKENSQ